MFCVWQSSVRGCRFSVMFVYLVIKMFKCSPVPASSFPYIRTALHSVSPPNNNNNAMQQFQNSIIYINIRACTILPVKVVEPNI